jgi:hypothetical protein
MTVGVRALRGRRLLAPHVGRWNRGDAIAIAVAVIAAVIAGTIAAVGIGAPDRISQTYDGLFHLNAVAFIQSTGDASSFDLYRITHPGTGNEFYPAAWHAIVASTVQVSGAAIPLATNVVWLAVQGLIWTPGVALLAATVAPARRRTLAASAAAVGAIGLVGFPDLLLAWGTLYPTGLAYALLPLGVALTVRLLRWVSLAPAERRMPFPGLLVAILAIWLIASSFSHPRSLFGWVLISAPLVAVASIHAVRRIWREPARRRRLVIALVSVTTGIGVVVAAGGLYVYRTFDLANRPISDHLNGGPATASQDVAASIWQALTLAPPSPSSPGQLPAAWVLAALVLAGVGVAAMNRRTRWLAVAWALVVIFYVLAAGSNSDIAKVLTGVWYKDKFRLFALLPVVQAPMIALLVSAVASLLRGRARIAVTVTAVVATAIAAATSNVVIASPAMIRAVFALPAHEKDGLLLDGDEQRLLKQLPRYVPAGDIVAGDPWDGSALSWAIGDRRALFPHLTGEWSADQLLVANSLDLLQRNALVCRAVHRLGVRWVVEDPQLLWDHPAEAIPYGGFHRAVQEGLLEPVARVGSAGLYRIPSCSE